MTAAREGAAVPAGRRETPLHGRVAANVRAEMARYQLTQAEIGQHLALSVQGVSQRMRGVVEFGLDELDVLAALFRMKPEDFIVGRPGPGGEPDHKGALVRRQGLEPRTRWLRACRAESTLAAARDDTPGATLIAPVAA